MQLFIFHPAVAHREEAVNQHVPKHPFARDERAETLPAEPNFPPSLTAQLSPHPAPAKPPFLSPPAGGRKGKASGPSREEGRWQLAPGAAPPGLSSSSCHWQQESGQGPRSRSWQGQSPSSSTCRDLHFPSEQPRGSGLSHEPSWDSPLHPGERESQPSAVGTAQAYSGSPRVQQPLGDGAAPSSCTSVPAASWCPSFC